MTYGCYQPLLDTWVRWIAAVVQLKEPYAQKYLVPNTGGQFLITALDRPAGTGQNDFERCMGKNMGYFVTVKGLKVCTT